MAQKTQPNDSIHNSEQGPQDGLTKREYFAAMAMQALITNDKDYNYCCDELAMYALRYADNLIIELNKEK